MTVIGHVFREIEAPKNMITYMSQKPCFRGPLHIEHGKWAEILLQSE